MSTQPHLELRRTGYFWRRRVPTSATHRFKPPFFCFPLRTHVFREAAAVARRITAISDICFCAEIVVLPDVMTRLLVTYARLEIEAADRLRALTGPRSRQAATAALEVEAAIRASLRDAIFTCEHAPGLRAIETTARHLGIDITGDDEELPVLADKMIRLMLEVSEERERRARGVFAESQPFLRRALAELAGTETSAAAAPEDRVHGPWITEPAPKQTTSVPMQAPMTDPAGRSSAPLPPPPASHKATQAPQRIDRDIGGNQVIYRDETATLSFAPPPALPLAPTEEPPLLALWDAWFDFKSEGVVRQGALMITDTSVAASFSRNADTTSSTRKLLEEFLGTSRVSDTGPADWQAFVNLIRRLPANHGKSAAARQTSLRAQIADADRREAPAIRAAHRDAARQNLSVEATRDLLASRQVARLSPRTVQRHQANLSAALDHAVASGRIPFNSFKPYVLTDKTVALLNKGRSDTQRKLWGDEFATLLRTERWQSLKTGIDDQLYWAPLIARMHGLRSEEILQLKTANIRHEGDIAYFDIVQGTGQTLKSNNARRLVPIHRQLLGLGFLDMVAHQRAAGQQRLFPKATRTQTKKLSYTANFTKAFRYYRVSHKIYDERMDFHALRTSFNSAMTTAAVPDTARRYMMGHDNPDVGVVNYLPEGFALATLKGFIDKQEFDLAMVSRRFLASPKAPTGPVLAVSNLVLPRAASAANQNRGDVIFAQRKQGEV